MKRRIFLAGAATLLAGCSAQTNALVGNGAVEHVIGGAQLLDHGLIGTHGRVQTFSDAEISREFRIDSLPTPTDEAYVRGVADGFRAYRLIVGGDVERAQAFGLPELRALASLEETTRHDCVEGWSAIGKWRGVPLGTLLAMVRPTARARYVVFDCLDADQGGTRYYESLDLQQAAHPQTVLAHALNGKPIDPDHGGPVRLRVPTQLGYKSAKWVKEIRLVASLAGTGGGNGGYWEDQGYEWYAGI